MAVGFTENVWLPGQDSNLDTKLQRLLCYRYTTRHRWPSNYTSGILPARRRLPRSALALLPLPLCLRRGLGDTPKPPARAAPSAHLLIEAEL